LAQGHHAAAAGLGLPAEGHLALDEVESPLPVMPYRQAVAGPGLAERLETTFRRHGWGGLWRNGIFPWHHFHDDAHEVLGIARGHALVQLGGEAGPELRLEAGDVAAMEAVAKVVINRLAALNQELADRTDGALFFHGTADTPDRAATCVETARIGGHVFYRPEE
jgi:hypothetical protein